MDGALIVQVLNREQTELAVMRLDCDSGAAKVLFTEKTDVWINVHNMLKPLKDGRFLWASERTGFRHLYIYESGGLKPVTGGDWQVEDVATCLQLVVCLEVLGALPQGKVDL